MTDERARALVCDIDGTLVDTNYHHAVAWWRAFQRCGVTEVEAWRLHRSIGMGSDKLIASVASQDVEDELGDEIRDAESELYGEMIDEVRPLPGAPELIAELAEAGVEIVLATSAKPDEAEHYVDLLGVRELCDWTSSGDVEDSKPAPDLVEAALEKLSQRPALMLGDTVWDCESAGRAGIASVAVMTGGFGRDELTEAGARRIYDSPNDIRDDVDAFLALVSPAA
ncbi:HAD family hydrolase [Thermoleophilia bacterium SCSIO 60948]|nr:HAD family hydrolase [Thermoleophilia bacterium SCSIO 60948]